MQVQLLEHHEHHYNMLHRPAMPRYSCSFYYWTLDWLGSSLVNSQFTWLGHMNLYSLCTILWVTSNISYSFQMLPRRTSRRTLTSTWRTRRLRRRPSPSSPSSGSSRRRSVTRSPSERHVALPLCVETAGGSDGTVTMVWHLHVNKFIPVGTPGVVMWSAGERMQ